MRQLGGTIFSILLQLWIFNSAIAQGVTRGHVPGEIYVTSYTYAPAGDLWYRAILYSSNNGQNFELKFVNNGYNDTMFLGNLIADRTHGVLFNYDGNLRISHNYGENWEFVESEINANYYGGQIEGNIYKKQYPSFYLSTNYGLNFSLLTDSLYSAISEIGVEEGRLYGIGWDGNPPFTLYSLQNQGLISNSYILSTEIGGHYISGQFPKISRGTEPGEIYLITWHLPANYHIYRSINYGQSFTLQYISDTADFYYEQYRFTAGRQPGSFYVVKAKNWYDGINTYLHIYYSNNYAKTFTEYFHLLDENYPQYTDGNQVLAFSFDSLTPPVSGTIDQDSNKIELIVPHGTNLTELVPTITLSENASIKPESGISNNFTETVFYTVTAQNGDEREYKVIVWDTLNTVQTILTNNEKINIFPNPTSGIITIRTEPLFTTQGNYFLEVFNMQGQLLEKHDLNTIINQTKTINISNYRNGVYYIKLKKGHNTIVTRKIVFIK